MFGKGVCGSCGVVRLRLVCGKGVLLFYVCVAHVWQN